MNPVKYFRKVAFPLMVTLSGAVLITAQNVRPSTTGVQWSSDYAMHTYFNDRFLESPGNGVGRMVADPMRVHDSMRLRITSNDAYNLEAVELVGVVMHDKPVAFTRTVHCVGARFLAARPLTAFEERALVELTAGETVAVDANKTGRYVVGALRAKQDCLQCHKSYKTGDLLGALSYRLTPVNLVDSVAFEPNPH